jgi:hypothetical protein
VQFIASLDLGWVAAVKFQFPEQTGLVLFMARKNVDMKRLLSPTNVRYLTAAADFAGAAFALQLPRQEVIREDRSELDRALIRVRNKILALRALGISLKQVEANEKKKQKLDFLPVSPPLKPSKLKSAAKTKAVSTFEKLQEVPRWRRAAASAV